MADYLSRLASDFEANSANCGALKSVFIGGGTPTLLSPESLSFIFEKLKKHFHLCDATEVSIECNPETLDEKKADTLAGIVNRASLGVQSFEPRLRKTLGRQGNVESIAKAAKLLKARGIENLSMDLIYAIPGQSIEDWRRDLDKALDFEIKHLSAYALTIEEGSRLAGDNCDINEELAADMWPITEEILTTRGLKRYEISNYAIPGFECRHNLNVWHGDSYLGCGPAASSFDGAKRWTQRADLDAWTKGKSPEYDIVDEESRAREIFVMGLRTVSGWKLEELAKFRHVPDLEKIKLECAGFIEAGMMLFDPASIRLTEKGLLFWDSIAEAII